MSESTTELVKVAAWSGGLRCSAMSKRSRQQCGNTAIKGATKCRMHNGYAELKPSARLTHGITSKFVKTEDLPAILEKVRELDTNEGRKEVLKRSHAVLDLRLDNIPIESPEFHDVAVKVHDSKRRDIALLHEIEQSAEQAAPTLPVFNIAIGDSAQQTFEARTLEGHCRVRLLDGAPFMFDALTGGWMPAQLRKDEETGAEIYERVLVAKAD